MALSANSPVQGVYAAAITPRSKVGDLNFGATFELLDYLSAARVGGIAMFTAWGEYPTVALDDRARLLYLAIKRSGVPVLAGVGSATLDHSLTLAREARSAGAAALLLPPPLFYRCDPEDLREFYSLFVAQLGGGVEVFLSGEIDADTASELLQTGGFAGIEDGSGVLQPRLDGVTVLSNNDALFVEARSAGCGVISAAACAAPELAMALNQAIAAQDVARIDRLEALHRELAGWLDRFPVPVAVKTAVSVRGIQAGPLPVPLSLAKQKCLDQFREWFQSWLPATRKVAAHA